MGGDVRSWLLRVEEFLEGRIQRFRWVFVVVLVSSPEPPHTDEPPFRPRPFPLFPQNFEIAPTSCIQHFKKFKLWELYAKEWNVSWQRLFYALMGDKLNESSLAAGAVK